MRGKLFRQVFSAASVNSFSGSGGIPRRSPTCTTTLATPRIRRESFSRISSVRLCSVATLVHHADVACFAAVRTVIQTVNAKPNPVLALAEAAILPAGALLLGLIAL